jgi:hypothetical protein
MIIARTQIYGPDTELRTVDVHWAKISPGTRAHAQRLSSWNFRYCTNHTASKGVRLIALTSKPDRPFMLMKY